MQTRRNESTLAGALALAFTLTACSGGGGGGGLAPGALTGAAASRSSSIALTRDDRRAVVVNRDANSVTVLRVRNGNGTDVEETLAEIPVGLEPRAVALDPKDRRAYVANTVSGTVSVVELGGSSGYVVSHTIDVGTEPRALAVSPSGKRVFVANHTEGTLSVIDTQSFTVVETRVVGGNPAAVLVTNDGDSDDADETIYVAQFYAELVEGGPGEAFDTGKQGIVLALPLASGAADEIVLSPVENSGFGANRAPFCAAFNATVHSQIFCPDTSITDATNPLIANDVQGAYPNQLQSLVLRNGRIFVPSIAASPEPPVRFNVNVQALVHVLDAAAHEEIPSLTVNLNAQIKNEVQPSQPAGSLVRLFANDVVAIDANTEGTRFFFVSRGGNCVIEGALDANGAITLAAPDVVRYQTGNLPTGIVVSRDGKRAYVNNEAGFSVSVLDLAAKTVLTRDLSASNPPAPGTFGHGVLVGKIAFETALGLPDSGVFGTPVRDLVPLDHRNKASDNGWSSCASCHPDGLADGVTWVFGTGPRQTLPLDAFFSKQSSLDQRISNWSGVMGSVTDFNNNARGVQGGEGFAGNPPSTAIFQHGITEGASDSLDAMSLWVQTVRAPILPETTDALALATGEQVFGASCASCHAGAKWSKSQVIYDNNPTFDKDPAAGGVVVDPGITNAGPQIVSFTEAGVVLRFLDPVGTFNAANPLEIRGQGAAQGNTALGAVGFNAPSLLGVGYHAPYLHDGSAQTLQEVFTKHGFGGGTIASTFTPEELAGLEVFLRSIDGSTATFESATDAFLRALGR